MGGEVAHARNWMVGPSGHVVCAGQLIGLFTLFVLGKKPEQVASGNARITQIVVT